MRKTDRIYGEKTRRLLNSGRRTVTWRDLDDRPDRNKAFLHYLMKTGKLELVKRGVRGGIYSEAPIYKIKVELK